MDYSTNEEANILARLGILNSTLECPRKKEKSKMDVKNTFSRSTKHSRAGSSAALDEDSSDDCLFDNERFANNPRKVRKNRRSARQDTDEHRYSTWHYFALFCSFIFIGLSTAIRDSSLSNFANSNFSHINETTDFLSNYFTAYGFGTFAGSILAGFIFVHFNTYLLIPLAMLISMPLFGAVIFGHSSAFLLTVITVLHVIFLTVIERGGLLISGTASSRKKIFFCIYLAMSLGSLFGSIISPPLAHIYNTTGDIAQPFHGINKREVANNTTLVFSTTPPPLLELNATNSTVSSTMTTTVKPSEDKEVFKTKTEENMIKRKEAERRKKEKEEEDKKKALEAAMLETSTTTSPTTAINSTTTSTTTTTPPTTTTTEATTTTTTTPITTTTESTTTTTPSTTTTATTSSKPLTSAPIVHPSLNIFNSKEPEDSASQENMTQPMWNVWPKIAPVVQRPAGHGAHIVALVLMSALILPSVLGFCCCKFLLTITADIPILEISQQAKQSPSAIEPIGCRILSGLVWTIHTIVEILLLLFLPVKISSIVSESKSIIPIAAMLHFPTVFCRLLFVIWPEIGSHANLIHIFYVASLLLSLIVQHTLPTSDIQLCAEVLILGLFASTLPLMIYSWQANFLEANPMHISSRYLVYTFFGRLIAPYFFSWIISSSSNQLSDIVTPFYNSFTLFHAIGYVLFIFLVTSAHKARRQMQIIQLSGAINGQPNANGPKSNGAKVKGQYKALMEEIDGSSDEGDDLAMDIISADDSDSDRSFV